MGNYSEDNLSTQSPSIFLGSQCGAQGSTLDPAAGMSFANCTMEPILVDCKVFCTGMKCVVTDIRHAQYPDQKSTYGLTDLMSNCNTEYFDIFSQELAFAIPWMYTWNYQSTPTEVYMSGEESYPYSTPETGGQVNLSE